MHASSFENMQRCVEKYAPSAAELDGPLRVVELGSADVNGSYRSLFAGQAVTYVGVDIEAAPGVDLVARDPYHLPLPDQDADIVLSGQALEHSEFFWLAFREMVRILRPNGYAFLIVPSAGPIHRYPVDCYRFYPDSMAALAKYAGCCLVECWHDDRGPWNDIVAVFSREQQTPRRGPPAVPAFPLALATQTPSPVEAEEEARGAVPYLDVLRHLHEILEPDPYLEIGVRRGHSLRCAKGRAIAVDPWPDVAEPLGENVQMWRETSDWFFELHAAESLRQEPDLAFIDGMHRIEFALRDFMNVEKHSHPGTVAVFDDVFPNHPAQASRERRTLVWTGDVWKIVPVLRRYRPELTLIPIDAHPAGLLIVLGLDRENRVLRAKYNPLVSELIGMPSEPPQEFIERRGCRSALDRATVELLAAIRATRGSEASQDKVRRLSAAWNASEAGLQTVRPAQPLPGGSRDRAAGDA
jgi:SAM-dependent methyltransferase